MKIALKIFSRDLRTHDNEALNAAAESGLPVLCVFSLDSMKIESSWLGIERWSGHKLRFLAESLDDLSEQLKSLGSRLVIMEKSISDFIESLPNSIELDSVYLHSETAWEELKEERQIEQAAKSKGAELRRFYGQSLYHPADLPFKAEGMPNVFTPFRKKIEKTVEIRECLEAPEKLEYMEDFNHFESVSIWDSYPEISGVEPRFVGGSQMAEERLRYYFWDTGKLGFYKKTRNQLLGDDYSSKFSPWLAWGCISPRRIYWEVKRFERDRIKNSSTYWLVFELIWRDFFRFHGAKASRSLFFKDGFQGNEHDGVINMRTFEMWSVGKTKNDFVDANMVELLDTGFMSNRGRQNVASYLVHDLKLDWRLGALWFEQRLIDYDVYSNYGNWQYVAGVGTDPRPDRYFNTNTQAERYDTAGKYRKYWLSGR